MTMVDGQEKPLTDGKHQQSEATVEFLRVCRRDLSSSSVAKEEFLPFFAIDNTAMDEVASHALVVHNIKSLTKLLTESFRVFLGCIIFNKSCDIFLDTFLTHRSRPCDAAPHTPVPTTSQHAKNLTHLDHMVFRLYLRLTSSPERMANNDSVCAAALPELLPFLRALRLPRLLSLFAVMGDSNRLHAQQVFSNTVALCAGLLREECATCAAGTYQTVCEMTQRLHALIVPEVVVAKKHKVVDLSHSRPKKNTLKSRDVFSVRGAGMKHCDQGLTPEACDLAEFVMDITFSLCMWIEAAGNILCIVADDGDDDAGLHLIGGDGLSISGVCGVMVASMALLYERTIPLLEKALASSLGAENTRVAYITQTCRELTVQMMKTLMSASADRVACHDSGSRRIRADPEGKSVVIGWEDVVASLLSTGGDIQPLVTSFPTTEDVLGIIMGGGGLLADITRAHSTQFFSWFEQIFEHTDESRRQYIMTVLYDGDAGYLSRHVSVPAPTLLTDPSPDSEIVPDKKLAWQSPPPTDEPSPLEGHMDTLRSLFPNYGDAFLSAVLHAFDNDGERAVDGLLSENLPPTLTNMDRTSSLKIKSAFVGKSSTDAAVGISRAPGNTSSAASRTTPVGYSLEMKSEDKALQKQILQNISKKEEQDAAALLSAVTPDFIDDYDDQYDDAGLGSDRESSDQRNSTSIIMDRRGKPIKPKSKAKKAITTGSLRGIGTDSVDDTSGAGESERDRVLRLNKLMREKESEEEFWKGMQNTNRSEENRIAKKSHQATPIANHGGDSGSGDDPQVTDNTSGGKIDGDDNSNGSQGAAVKVSSSGANSSGSKGVPHSGANGKGKSKGRGKGKEKGDGDGDGGAPAAGARGDGKNRKPKTKTFDKHNQKNKSIKKFGGFS